VRDLEFGVAAEVRLAVQNVRSRLELVEVARFSQSLAEQELELAETRFAQGVADNREIVEAQNRLAVASDGLVEANFQYKLSQVELSRATGDVSRVLELAL
jgi:outer membrane protein TolC